MRFRLGLFGWLTLGWIIIPVWFLYLMARGIVETFLLLMRILDWYNRRRRVTRTTWR